MPTLPDSDKNALSEWHLCKQSLAKRKRLPLIKEGEIWWCHIGLNVGIEINGKGSIFLRPVLIYKKFSALGFFGIPLTTQNHNEKDWYVPFRFRKNTSWAALAQARTLSVERAFKRMGTVDDEDMRKIIAAFDKLYSKNFP